MREGRIVFVPLDERPCNYQFPLLMPRTGLRIQMPPMQLLGRKKRPADVDALAAWLLDQTGDADVLILSMDMLLYGGLIPSRLHAHSYETLCARADLVRTLKARDPALKIYGFQTIMRCPWYSLSDEEPDYYAQCGAELHLFGRYTHKQQLGLLTEEEQAQFDRVREAIPQAALEDYTSRRNCNINVLLHTLELVEEGLFEAFIIPQDDSAPYGFTSLDQARVCERLRQCRLQRRVPVYPAADDTGMTMLARAVNEWTGVTPSVYVYYASARGPLVTPSFEDRTIDATIKHQIRAAGCRRVYSLPEADILLAVNIGSEMLYLPDEAARRIPYDVERSLSEYLDMVEYALSLQKLVAIADVAIPTGSDLELIDLMHESGLLLSVHAYAGWNTSSNTIGTVLCQSCLYFAGRDDRGNRDFLLHRYYDDVGYCSHTRTFIDETAVPQNGCTVFVLDGERGKCVQAAKQELIRFMRGRYPELAACVEELEVSSPWNRTFEMQFDLTSKDEI